MLKNKKTYRACLAFSMAFFALNACQKTPTQTALSQREEAKLGINNSLEGYQPLTPLMEAVLSNDLKKAESLIQQGVEINQLIGSIEDTNLGAYSYYIDKSRPPKTALGLALQHSHGLSPLALRLPVTKSPDTLINDISLLLQYGARPNQSASFEAMLLHNPSLEAAKLLIQYGGNPL